MAELAASRRSPVCAQANAGETMQAMATTNNEERRIAHLLDVTAADDAPPFGRDAARATRQRSGPDADACVVVRL